MLSQIFLPPPPESLQLLCPAATLVFSAHSLVALSPAQLPPPTHPPAQIGHSLCRASRHTGSTPQICSATAAPCRSGAGSPHYRTGRSMPGSQQGLSSDTLTISFTLRLSEASDGSRPQLPPSKSDFTRSSCAECQAPTQLPREACSLHLHVGLHVKRDECRAGKSGLQEPPGFMSSTCSTPGHVTMGQKRWALTQWLPILWPGL